MGKLQVLLQSDLDISTAQIYIVWGKGKELVFVQLHVLCMETYSNKTLKS